MAEGEQRTHDYLAAHPRVSGGEQGRTGTPAEIRASIRSVAEKGTDGLKILAMDCDQVEAILGGARRLGLRTTAHVGLEETTAKDYIELGSARLSTSAARQTRPFLASRTIRRT